MHSALRKMGNSTGLIVPRALLAEIGATSGAAMDLRVEDGKLIATPVTSPVRAGWASAAEAVADEDPAADWRGFGNDEDRDLVW